MTQIERTLEEAKKQLAKDINEALHDPDRQEVGIHGQESVTVPWPQPDSYRVTVWHRLKRWWKR